MPTPKYHRNLPQFHSRASDTTMICLLALIYVALWVIVLSLAWKHSSQVTLSTQQPDSDQSVEVTFG